MSDPLASLPAHPLFGIALTVAAYAVAVVLWRRAGHASLVHPVLVATMLVAGVLLVAGVPYADYFGQAAPLNAALGLVVLLLAVPLCRRMADIGTAVPVLATALVVGSIVALTTALALPTIAGADDGLLATLAPKSGRCLDCVLKSAQVGKNIYETSISERTMNKARFRRLCAGMKRLSVGQMRALRGQLRALDTRIEVLSRIDARGQALTECVHCAAPSLQRWGETRTGLPRLRCKACRRTFSSATGTVLERIRRPEKLLAVLRDMMSTSPRSCRALARCLELDKTTVWRWRLSLLQALIGAGASELNGIVEADEKFFRESRKGSREWVDHERDPTRHAEPDRPRWRDFRRLRLLFPAGLSAWQIPVLTLTDRTGARRADVLPDRRATSLVSRLEAHVGQDAVLCTDGDSAYDLFARQRAMPHYRLHPKKGPRVIAKAFHMQTVNNLHSRFETFMKPFCGPATKNLPAYAAWFVSRLVGNQQDAENAAWQIALAA